MVASSSFFLAVNLRLHDLAAAIEPLGDIPVPKILLFVLCQLFYFILLGGGGGGRRAQLLAACAQQQHQHISPLILPPHRPPRWSRNVPRAIAVVVRSRRSGGCSRMRSTEATSLGPP